jgi:uncharacterized protein HemX
MYSKLTRLTVLTAALAIATAVVPSVLAQDREPERASDTVHCKEIKERRHQEARRLHARQHDELARCGAAASASCAEIKERHKREIREWKERSKDELKDCKQDRKEGKKDKD